MGTGESDGERERDRKRERGRGREREREMRCPAARTTHDANLEVELLLEIPVEALLEEGSCQIRVDVLWSFQVEGGVYLGWGTGAVKDEKGERGESRRDAGKER